MRILGTKDAQMLQSLDRPAIVAPTEHSSNKRLYICIYISLFKVDKNHNSLLTNKKKLILKKDYNHINHIYPTLAINLLHRLHGQSSQLHNFISASLRMHENNTIQ